MNVLPIVILNGRPAAGKSEVIDYLKNVSTEERIQRFHIGEFEEIDDFPILWERFEDDDLYEAHGLERKYSDTEFTYQGETLQGYVFKERFFWDFLIYKLNRLYEQRYLRNETATPRTAIIEFSRGSQHGGFRQAYQCLSESILERAVTVYIHVSFEESMRKNRRRFNPDDPGSILEHALEDRKLEMLYKESDWQEFASTGPDHLIVGEHQVPYHVLENEPEITDQPEKLGQALEDAFSHLWQLHQAR